MGEKRSNVFQTLSRKHHHVKTYLQPVVRVYKSKIIKEVHLQFAGTTTYMYIIFLLLKVPPSQLKETFWLIRKYNEKKILKASWSEMLDNSVSRRTTLKWEKDNFFREKIPSGYRVEETEGGAGGCSELLQILTRLCGQEEIQLVLSYMLISLAAGLLLPATYWVVLRIYTQL